MTFFRHGGGRGRRPSFHDDDIGGETAQGRGGRGEGRGFGLGRGGGHGRGGRGRGGRGGGVGSGWGRGGMLFGVRRPLRFMAEELELDDEQVQKLAALLERLKTERAQAAVDDRRAIGKFADALEKPEFDRGEVDAALALRTANAERLREAVGQALADTHGMLDPAQRKHLAYLLRSGALTI